MAQTYRSTVTTVSQFSFAQKKFLANASINASQTQVGVVTKPLDGYVVFMLDFINFAIDTNYEDASVDEMLDYCIKNS
jgi:hypothetical protein